MSDNHIHVALRTLGLEPGASWQEVKSGYKALVKSSHPDRKSASARQEADDRLKIYNNARDILKEHFESSHLANGYCLCRPDPSASEHSASGEPSADFAPGDGESNDKTREKAAGADAAASKATNGNRAQPGLRDRVLIALLVAVALFAFWDFFRLKPADHSTTGSARPQDSPPPLPFDHPHRIDIDRVDARRMREARINDKAETVESVTSRKTKSVTETGVDSEARRDYLVAKTAIARLEQEIASLEGKLANLRSIDPTAINRELDLRKRDLALQMTKMAQAEQILQDQGITNPEAGR